MTDLTLRTATVDDAQAIAQIHLNGWRTTYRGLVPDAYIESLDQNRRTARWKDMLTNGDEKVIVATKGETVIGFVSGGETRNTLTDNPGEIYAVYVDETYRGQGVGKQLCDKMMRWLEKSKLSPVVVWVAEGNPHRHFYEALGGELINIKRSYTIHESELPLVAYRLLPLG